jgi:prolyl-tRNA synthetase
VDEEGKVKPFIMGCYGIGVSRTVAASIEQNNDDSGIIWPISIAPFEVSIVVLNYDKADQQNLAEKLYKEIGEAGIEVIIDDRIESAGKKFADSDLIGFPVQVVVGARTIKNGTLEVKIRATGEKFDFELETAVGEIIKVVDGLRSDIRARGERIG